MSSTSPSGSPADPHAPEQTLLPGHVKRPTVAESVFQLLDQYTRANNAACNAFILDKKTIPDFLREDDRWFVMVMPADYHRPIPIFYLGWTHDLDTHRKVFRRYREWLHNNVIQFEEHMRVSGVFELRIPTPHFRLDVLCPYKSDTKTPPDVVASPVPPQ